MDKWIMDDFTNTRAILISSNDINMLINFISERVKKIKEMEKKNE